MMMWWAQDQLNGLLKKRKHGRWQLVAPSPQDRFELRTKSLWHQPFLAAARSIGLANL
jgi:hypothetical protein